MIANSHKRSKESKGSITPDFLIMSRSLLYPKILIPMVFFLVFLFGGFFFFSPLIYASYMYFYQSLRLFHHKRGLFMGPETVISNLSMRFGLFF